MATGPRSSLRHICDEFTARQLERDYNDGQFSVQSVEKKNDHLVVELIDSRPTEKSAYIPMLDTLYLQCSQTTRERLFKLFNRETEPVSDVTFDPYHPSANIGILSKKHSVHSCHGITGTYKGSKTLGWVEHPRGPLGRVDQKSLRLRFLHDENGEERKPVFINYKTPRLAAEALDVLKETAQQNRQGRSVNRPSQNVRSEQCLQVNAGLHKFLG